MHNIQKMSVDDEILACEAVLVQAQLDGDANALDRLLDDDLLFAGMDGNLFTKQDDLAMHRSGQLRVIKMDAIDRRILHLGDTSVVTVLMDAEAVINGSSTASTLRYTRVWHRRPQGWRIVAGQMSLVANPR